MNTSVSDKMFWHGYIDFYEKYFTAFSPKSILELGIDQGHSVRWLLNRFPDAVITGVDILERRAEWPVDKRFSSRVLDQGNRKDLESFFGSSKFDLIIEDGSHHPQHQIDCLILGMNSLTKGGIYILEDIHTSHFSSPYYQPRAFFRRLFRSNALPRRGNALNILLAIDHYKRLNRTISHEIATLIASDSLFSPEQVVQLSNEIEFAKLYRRANLPDRCVCGSSDYHFSEYRCTCGRPIFADDDSMTFLIKKKDN